MISTVWTDSIKAHLDVLTQTCKHIPAGETLDVKELNQILSKFDECKGSFLFMCELYGFKALKKQTNK